MICYVVNLFRSGLEKISPAVDNSEIPHSEIPYSHHSFSYALSWTKAKCLHLKSTYWKAQFPHLSSYFIFTCLLSVNSREKLFNIKNAITATSHWPLLNEIILKLFQYTRIVEPLFKVTCKLFSFFLMLFCPSISENVVKGHVFSLGFD